AASIPALAAGSRRWLRKIDRSAFDLQEGLHCRLMGDDQRPIIGIVESQRRGRILAIRRLFLVQEVAEAIHVRGDGEGCQPVNGLLRLESEPLSQIFLAQIVLGADDVKVGGILHDDGAEGRIDLPNAEPEMLLECGWAEGTRSLESGSADAAAARGSQVQ